MFVSPEAPSVHQRRLVRWCSIAGLVALVLVGIGSALSALPQEPRPADVPADEFSAARAMDHVEAIADAPRPVGSDNHAEARGYIIEQLESWGISAEVQRAVGIASYPQSRTQRAAEVSNVVATIPGSSPTGTLILAAHYDTVAGSPGAADDGIGVATLLEVARAISADETMSPRNDIMLLVTDAEERGLLGAEAFVHERADELDPAVVLNHEARGASGTPATFRVSSPNAVLIDALSGQPGAFADSAFNTAFEQLPNDTDATRFFEAGMYGFDTAITGGGAFYHSPLDRPEHLSEASLQQMGSTSLGLTRELAGIDLASVDDGGEETVVSLPWGLLHYPRAAEGPLAVVTLVLAGFAVATLRWRTVLTLPRTAVSAGAAGLALAAAGAAAVAVWKGALLVDSGQASAVVGEPYRPGAYQLAMLAAGAGVVLGAYVVLRRWVGAAASAAGALLAVSALGASAAFAVSGVSHLLVLPALPAAAGLLIAALLPEGWAPIRTCVLVLGLVPAALLLGNLVFSTFEVGLAIGGPLSTVLLAVFVLLALPVVTTVWSGEAPGGALTAATETRQWRFGRSVGPPAAVLGLVVALIAAGLVVNREGATPPRQEQLLYSVDAATGQALWASTNEPATEWSRSLASAEPAPLSDAFPWRDDQPLAHGQAPAADLPAPELEIVGEESNQESDEQRRELTLRLASARDASSLGVWVDGRSATVHRATVGDREIPVNTATGGLGVLVEGVAADGVEVRLVLDQHASDLDVRIADRSHDLTGIPGFTPPAEGRELTEPEVAVTREVAL